MKKLLSLTLTILMVFSLVSPILVSADYYDTELTMPENGSVELIAGYASDYHWQIQIDDQWVNIADATDNTLTVRYAMVANAIVGDTAYFRYTDGETDTDVYSVTVTEPELAETEATVVEPEVLDEGEVVFEIIDFMLEETTKAIGDFTEFFKEIFASFSGISTYSEDGISTVDNTEADVKKTYNIVINYIFENNKLASDPYTASLAEGSSFSATVTFPTVQGYLPYVNDVQQNSIELNYTSISEDVTINVVYKPTNVDYKIIHYQQNIENDEYVQFEVETKQGLTGSQVPEVQKSYTGFYNLLYERPNIAADGSTVIEIYYDRYYYLMNFDMDGGYGTEPVYARYGASIGTVTEPTKAGYSFEGWAETKPTGNVGEIVTTVTIPTTMPAENKTYYAVWDADETVRVTIVFWGENADNEEYSYLEEHQLYVKQQDGFMYTEDGSTVVCGKEEHTHIDDCYELTCDIETHEHNSECIQCGITPHTHSAGCYPGAGSSASPLNPPDNPKEGQVYSGSVWFVDYSYIYVKGSWYNYSGSVANGKTVSPNCGMEENNHVHSADCIKCGKEEHEHTKEECYKITCKKTEHKHSVSCYTSGVAAPDSTLWKYVKSDVVDLAQDGSSKVNVYYERVEYSVQFYNNQSCSTSGLDNKEYTDLKITAKWGENILDKWPTKNGSSSWYVKDKSNTWQNSIQVMPVGGAKFWGPKSGNSKYTATYYVEILDGESYDVKGSDGRYYKVHHTDTSNSSGNVTDEERYGIDGFTINNSISTKNGNQYGGSKFYYTRNSYNLNFNNGFEVTKRESVKFEASLSTYKDYVPEAPNTYEPGSVVFSGWYQNPACTGEEYKLDEHTMPSHDLILYAKWVPVTHTVKFYLTEKSESIYKPASADTEASFTVAHGDNIAEEYVKNHLEKSAMNEAKPNGDYTFVMWYYYENGDKKPFDPTTQIRKDLTLYGEWSSNTLKEYTVQYVLQSDHSTKVADDLTGSGLAGTTKTFDAKGGTELYAAYQEGYFPTVQSQSLLLDIESDSLVITFEYVPRDAVPYTVMYITDETVDDSTTKYGTVTVNGKTYTKLAKDFTDENNRKAVVTETFKPISGYMPDAYQKRLVVVAEGENILYFYYTKDETHAYYKITHYTQNTDGATWTEYASSQAVGDIGTRYTGSPMTIPGFTYDHIEYKVNGEAVDDVTADGAELTADGLEINLYYVRNSYPYEVRYVKSETNEDGGHDQLLDPEKGKELYGKVVSGEQKTIEGYEFDKVEPESGTISIQIEESEDTAVKNIITFYYKEMVTINYVAVGPEGATNFGSVSPETEKVASQGDAQGSKPTADSGYKFVGWFKDAGCTEKVEGEGWLEGDKIVPQKTDGKNVAATYYAKFEANVTDLTIEKKISGTQYDDNEKFIFTVEGNDSTIEVTVKANTSVTIKGLKVGEPYTITEKTDWSWRYTTVCDSTGGSITLVAKAEDNVVTFTNTLNNNKYLTGDAYCDNKWEDGEINVDRSPENGSTATSYTFDPTTFNTRRLGQVATFSAPTANTASPKIAEATEPVADTPKKVTIHFGSNNK